MKYFVAKKLKFLVTKYFVAKKLKFLVTKYLVTVGIVVDGISDENPFITIRKN